MPLERDDELCGTWRDACHAFRVRWSDEDDAYVATCDQHAWLSHVDASAWDAREGIVALVADVEADEGAR
jgi:hypothetical protein